MAQRSWLEAPADCMASGLKRQPTKRLWLKVSAAEVQPFASLCSMPLALRETHTIFVLGACKSLDVDQCSGMCSSDLCPTTTDANGSAR